MASVPDGEFLLPIFPLPGVVFFPGTRLPLHVFEPRYRQMVADAAASDQRIGIVLLRPGWELNYYGSPLVHEFGTVGRIEQLLQFDDGRYNILLHGDVRVRLAEQVSESPYRIVRAVAMPEKECSAEQTSTIREWLADLSRTYLELLPQPADVPELATAKLDSLINALAMSLPMTSEQKQDLLELPTVRARAERIGKELSARIESMQFLAPYRRDLKDPTLN